MSINEYHEYAIRLDGNSSEKLVEFLEKDGGSYLVVKELEDSNPHYHVLLFSRRSIQALRMSFKRSVPEAAGNGAYSVAAVRDLEKYERYMMKGDSDAEMPVVVASKGIKYTAQWIEETHAAYWSRNQEVQEERREMKVHEAVLQACKEQQVLWSNREKISELYIRELVARDKPINLFSIRSAVCLLQVHLCPDDSAVLDLAAQCAKY